MSKIDITKKYRTRDGRAVRILATDIKNEPWVVAAAIRNDGGYEIVMPYMADGSSASCRETHLDLIEVRPRHKFYMWVNVYSPCLVRDSVAGSGWRTREDADLSARSGRVACIKVEIDCEEGEGL